MPSGSSTIVSSASARKVQNEAKACIVSVLPTASCVPLFTLSWSPISWAAPRMTPHHQANARAGLPLRSRCCFITHHKQTTNGRKWNVNLQIELNGTK